MTFDEALEVLANSEKNKLVKEGQLEYGLYRAYDVVSVLQKLRKEYAPIVEMTSRQKETILTMKENKCSLINIVAEFDHDNLINDFDGFYWFPMTEIQLVQAWLHPETIKIVDE